MPRAAWVAIASVTLARVLYLVFLSPYELVADEAQYWDWSRRLDLSYYSKGPAIAWLIGASTTVFGVSEWAIRLPAALSFAVTSAAAAHLALAWAPDRSARTRLALIAVGLVVLMPAYQLSALLMTIDAPYIACWALALCATWRAYLGEREDSPSMWAWVSCGLAIGAGFLFKYSMLLFIPGLLLFAWTERGHARPGLWGRAAAAALAVAVCASPVILWNATHDAAGWSHLLGHLEAPGGDRLTRSGVGYDPGWTLSFLGAQAAIVGPMLALMWTGARQWCDYAGGRLAIATAGSMLTAFTAVTFRVPAEANWPIAAYASLIPLAALAAAGSVATPRVWWRATVAYGTVALLAIGAPLVVADVPGVGAWVPTHRFRGFAAAARELAGPIDAAQARSREPVLLVATSHNAAGLLAFYLPGRPVVASAGRYLGDRPSAYDFFTETSLTSERTRGRPAILIGGRADRWAHALVVRDLSLLSPRGPQFLARRLDGPR